MIYLIAAIVAAQEELAQCNKLNSKPVLEEFIPLKKIYSDEKVEEKVEDSKEKVISSIDKKHWMSSVQLWNADDQNSNSNTADYSSNRLSSNTDTNKKKVWQRCIYILGYNMCLYYFLFV